MKSKASLKTVHREKKGTPTDFLTNKIGCHRSFNTTFGLALSPPYLACCSSSSLNQAFRIGICELIPSFIKLYPHFPEFMATLILGTKQKLQGQTRPQREDEVPPLLAISTGTGRLHALPV
jgi:hypothetical protein